MNDIEKMKKEIGCCIEPENYFQAINELNRLHLTAQINRVCFVNYISVELWSDITSESTGRIYFCFTRNRCKEKLVSMMKELEENGWKIIKKEVEL